MSSTRIDQLVDEAQAAFDRRPTAIEPGLEVEDAGPLQLRKACRLLAGADALHEADYYTLVIEAAFVAIERTVEFRLLERGTMEPDDLPGTHPGVYREAASVGIFAESAAEELADLWRDHRAKTYYQDGLASAERARAMTALATELRDFVVGRSSQGHECRVPTTTATPTRAGDRYGDQTTVVTPPKTPAVMRSRPRLPRNVATANFG